MGTCTEEQRLQILQHLQLQAQQGDNQAAAALSNLSSEMAAMTSPPPQVILRAASDSVALFGRSVHLYLVRLPRRRATAGGPSLQRLCKSLNRGSSGDIGGPSKDVNIESCNSWSVYLHWKGTLCVSPCTCFIGCSYRPFIVPALEANIRRSE